MQYAHPLPFGAEIDSHGTHFRLWAPSARRVDLILPNREPQPLQPAANGYRTVTIKDAGAGTRYRYRIDGEIDVPDPASRCNPDGVHAASEVIDPREFRWNDDDWRGLPWHRAVVYELHVGTFTAEGTFAAAIPRLGELAELGINTLELMPVNAFSGRHGWGYDGVLPYAPHPAYGRPDNLKRLVEAAHAHQIMVLLDVVYNHFGPDGNYLPRYAKEFFTVRHHTPWGNAINFEGDSGRHVRRFFIENALYWINEYRFDGLRLDAVHAMLDDSEQHFIAELIETVQHGPGKERLIHLVLENHHNESRYLQGGSNSGQGGVAQWNDDFHHPLHVILTGETDGYYSDFMEKPLAQLGRVLAEGFAFQGEVSHFDGDMPRGEPSAHLPPTAFVNFLQTHDQVGNRAFGERLAALAPPERLRAAMAMLLLAPQVPLLFMGEEYAAPQPFLYFCDYTGELAMAVTNGRRKEFEQFRMFADAKVREKIPDPNDEGTFAASRLDWQGRDHPVQREFLQYVRGLLKVRQQTIAPLIPQISGGRWSVHRQVLEVVWQVEGAEALIMLANLDDTSTPTPENISADLLFSNVGAHTSEMQPEVQLQIQPWEVRLLRSR